MSDMIRAGLEQRASFTPGNAGLLHRKCDKCRKKKQLLQRSSGEQYGPSAVPPIVHDVLNSPGQPLDSETRAFFEPRFGDDFGKMLVHSVTPQTAPSDLRVGPSNDRYEKEADQVADRIMKTPQSGEPNRQEEARFDLSKVRLHTDARAAQSAQAIGARAFTVGRDIIFGAEQFENGTAAGRRLLAHELAHFVQQSGEVPAGSIQREDSAEESGDLGGGGTETGAADLACGSSTNVDFINSWKSKKFTVGDGNKITICCTSAWNNPGHCQGGTFTVQLQKWGALWNTDIRDPVEFEIGSNKCTSVASAI